MLRTVATWMFAVFAAANAAAAAPAPAVQQEIAARRIAAYLAAIDSPAAAELFIERDLTPEYRDSAPPGAILNYFATQKRVAGGYTFESLRVTSPSRAEALLRDQVYGARHRLTMDFEAEPARRILEFDPGPAPAWAEPLPAVLDQAQTAAAIRQKIERGCAAEVFAGAALVARRGEVLVEHACGLASRRYGVPNTIDTRFNLGSINKMFTAVAVMQLVEAGKLSLDDTIDRFLDGSWLAPDVAGTITVRQLLSHTSGLGSFVGAEWDQQSRRKFRELGDYKPLVRMERPAFPPGSSWSYSNTGPLLAGAIVERVSGQSYFEYVREHLYAPAGMTDTDCWALDEPVPRLAMGYYPSGDGAWRENTFATLFRGSPAGGGYSTVHDMLRFANALVEGRLISTSSLRVLWTDHPPHEYGAGFTIEQTAAGPSYGHDGLMGGVSSRFHIYPKGGFIVVILSNQDFGAAGLDEALTEVIAQARP